MKVTSGRLLDATAYAGRMVVRAQARGPGGGLVRVRRGLRVLVAGMSVAVMLFGIGGAAGVMRQRPEPPAAAGPVPDNRSEVESATAQARASGARVEVVGARSETRQVFAQPSGAFTMELNDRPVRVRKGGGWVAPDPTLQARQDGTMTPVAAARPLVLSGGGSAAPLVRLADGDRSIELRWPDPLPVPVLAGDTATSSDVFPDVDLRVRAGVQGFSEVLVVKTRQAAREPRLANVRFGLTTVGLTARLNAYGGVSLTDQTGTPVFASSTVHMWDSGTRRGKGALTLIVHYNWKPNVPTGLYAGELAAGDLLLIAENRLVAVAGVHRYGGEQIMYDLTVDATHTYFVNAGGDDALVHNNNGACPVHPVAGRPDIVDPNAKGPCTCPGGSEAKGAGERHPGEGQPERQTSSVADVAG